MTTKAKRVPYAEMKARRDLVLSGLDDVRSLVEKADPEGDPAGFEEIQRKATAIFDQMSSLLPQTHLSDEERERLEEQLEDKPDDETVRAMLLEMEKIADDPEMPDEVRKVVDKAQIREALAALDEVELLAPVARAAAALSEAMTAPKARRDEKAVAVREAMAKSAAKLRS